MEWKMEQDPTRSNKRPLCTTDYSCYDIEDLCLMDFDEDEGEEECKKRRRVCFNPYLEEGTEYDRQYTNTQLTPEEKKEYDEHYDHAHLTRQERNIRDIWKPIVSDFCSKINLCV